MSSKIYKPKTVIYMAANEDGEQHFYSRNPVEMPASEDLSKWETSIGAEISEYIPHSDRWHPIAIQMRFTLLKESMPFMPDKIDSIIDGTADMHVEDLSGAVVSLLPEPVKYGQYNIGGYIIDPETGQATELRLYNINGHCFDGKEEHTLELVSGKAAFEQYLSPIEITPSEEEKDDVQEEDTTGKTEDADKPSAEETVTVEPAGQVSEPTTETPPPPAEEDSTTGASNAESPIVPKLEPVAPTKEQQPKEHSETFKNYFRSISISRQERTTMTEEFKFEE